MNQLPTYGQQENLKQYGTNVKRTIVYFKKMLLTIKVNECCHHHYQASRIEILLILCKQRKVKSKG